jgi:uncharacterized protein (DUF1697 family)
VCQLRYVAFIRNIMVGRRGLTAEVLVQAFLESGGKDVRSVLSTGTIVYSAEDGQLVVGEATRRLRVAASLEEPIFVRSLNYLQTLVGESPFADAPTDAVYEQCVTFAAGGLAGIGHLPIESKRRDLCIFKIVGGEAFSITRMIGGRCGTAGPILEERCGQRVTTRNWKTVLRLIDK